MARLTEVTSYTELVQALLPRGPFWDGSAGLAGLVAGLGEEGVRLHNRMVALMREAFAATADELLPEWEDVYGLPLCDDAPTDDTSRRAALAGRLAAAGGQSGSYFVDIAWAVLGDDYDRTTHPDYVYVERWPYGTTLRAWTGRAWDPVGSTEVMFYWTLHLPISTSEDKAHVIECLINTFKPHYSIALFDYDTAAMIIGP